MDALIGAVMHILINEEGYREECYLCSEGYVTVGIGTKVHTQPLMDPTDFCIKVDLETAKALATRDVRRAISMIAVSEYGDLFGTLDVPRQAVLVSMVYQMGYGAFKFRRMWAALYDGRYDIAQVEALDSKWAKQTRSRALRHSQVLATGDPTIY